MISSLHNEDNTNTSGHSWHILGGLGSMSTEGSTHTGLTLPVLAHSGKYLAPIVSLLEDEEASKIFQNILAEPQHA